MSLPFELLFAALSPGHILPQATVAKQGRQRHHAQNHQRNAISDPYIEGVTAHMEKFRPIGKTHRALAKELQRLHQLTFQYFITGAQYDH
jgi:hypothetical protein